MRYTIAKNNETKSPKIYESIGKLEVNKHEKVVEKNNNSLGIIKANPLKDHMRKKVNEIYFEKSSINDSYVKDQTKSDSTKVTKKNYKSSKDLNIEDSKYSFVDLTPHTKPLEEEVVEETAKKPKDKTHTSNSTFDTGIGKRSDCPIDGAYTKFSNTVSRNIETGVELNPLANKVGSNFNNVAVNFQNEYTVQEIIVSNQQSQLSHFTNTDSAINKKNTIYIKKEKIQSNNMVADNLQKRTGEIKKNCISDKYSETQTPSDQFVNKITDGIHVIVNINGNLENSELLYRETFTESKGDVLDIKTDSKNHNFSSTIEIIGKKGCTKVDMDNMKECHNLADDNSSKGLPKIFERPGSANNMVWFPVKHTIALHKDKNVKKNRNIEQNNLRSLKRPIKSTNKILPLAKNCCTENSNEDMAFKEVFISNAHEMKIGKPNDKIDECSTENRNEEFQTLLKNNKIHCNNSEVDIYKSSINNIKSSAEINHTVTKNSNVSTMENKNFIEEITVKNKVTYRKENITKFNNCINPFNMGTNERDILGKKISFDTATSSIFRNVKINKSNRKDKKNLNVNNNESKSPLENLPCIPLQNKDKATLSYLLEVDKINICKENRTSYFNESRRSAGFELIDAYSNEECNDNILNYISNTFKGKDPIASTDMNTVNIQDKANLLNPKSNCDTVKRVKCNDLNARKLKKGILNKSQITTNRNKKDIERYRLTLSCDICDYKTNRKKYMESHVLLHIAKQDIKKIYSCTHCKYKTKNRHHLEYHLRTHTGEKPFHCSFCEQRFARKTNLINHMRTHTGEKPFSCKYCNYKCTDSSNLKTHVRTHTREKPFSCKFCNYSCIQSSTLVSHMRRHTGERPYTCDVCQKKFSGKGNLIKHQKTHLDIRPYVCKICQNKFSQKNT